MNICIFTGRIVKDPELKMTQSGKSVCSFRVAVPKDFNREGVDFLDFTAWEKTAEFIAKYFQKGKRINITSRAQTSTYTERETGKTRYKTEFIVDKAEFGSSKGEEDNNYTGFQQEREDDTQEQNHTPPTQAIAPAAGKYDIDDDDLPF